MAWARLPTARLPNGAMPRKDMENTDITRPRMSSRTQLCSRVLLPAAMSTREKPSTMRMG